MIPIETIKTPHIAEARLMMIRAGLPCIRRVGDRTNMKGMTKANQPNRMAAKPVRMGEAPDRVAAAKAPMATGGVMKDSIPK